MDEGEARSIMAAGLGREELKFAHSICAPLWWIYRDEKGLRHPRNGTAFFLDTGTRVFAVTAAHVLAGLEQDRRAYRVEFVQLGQDLTLDLEGRHSVIDRHEGLDIATFCIERSEVAAINKNVLTGLQSMWPPKPPERDRGVYFCGFAGRERILISPRELSFGTVMGAGVADEVNSRDVSMLFDRRYWIDVMGLSLPCERFDYGGISGGPMLSVVERNGFRSWSLAGVIHQGPNPSTEESIPGFEILKARRSDFIGADGHLDLLRWDWL